MSKISMKQLLSHTETKQDLTVYLAEKTINALEEININYILTYDTIRRTNLDNFSDFMTAHDHEEADTLLILHCSLIALFILQIQMCFSFSYIIIHSCHNQ